MTVLMIVLNKDHIYSASIIPGVEFFWSCLVYFVVNNFHPQVPSWIKLGALHKLYFEQFTSAGCNNSYLFCPGLTMWSWTFLCSLYVLDFMVFLAFCVISTCWFLLCIGRNYAYPTLDCHPGLLGSPGPIFIVVFLNE